ncbi:hypothetical protein ABPG72_009577 [Tetrahymena utriculariae]
MSISKPGEGGTKQHTLHEFKDIIKQVRECKTAAQERELINKEKALIRERFLQNKEETRAKDVAKLLYISMLGHNTDFGQMECLKLITSQNYGNKRIGYLGLCQLFHENSEILMLATNRIHIDLGHTNNYVLSLAIVALNEICTTEMCRELIPDLIKQFQVGSTFIKKKVALCCIKMVKKLPEATSDIVQQIDSLMEDKHHGVLLSTVSLMKSLVVLNEENKNYFYKHITPLKKILKALISNMSAEFDVNGVNDPFLQIAILEFFRMMAQGKQHVADEISGILGEVASNTNGDKNSGSAVLYECVKTVMEIGSTSSLKILCINVLGKFLKNAEPNIKYVSLYMLQKVLNYDLKTVQKYMQTIIQCLKEEDVSIKQLALDLIFMVSSSENVESIIKELLNHMIDPEQLIFLPELVLKTCMIIDSHAPNRRWQIDTIIKVLSLAGSYAKEDTTNNLINLISVSPSLQQYAVQKLYFALKQKIDQSGLVVVSLYCFGEYGHKLVTAAQGSEDSISEKDVYNLISKAFEKYVENDDVKEYGMNCLMKLFYKFTSLTLDNYANILNPLTTSTSPEVQKRACEYLHIIQNEWKNQVHYIFQTNPEYSKATQQFSKKPVDEQSQKKQTNLLEDEEIPHTPVNQAQSAQQNILDDLIGGTSTTNNVPTTSSILGEKNGIDLLNDIIGGTSYAPSSQSDNKVQKNLITDLLDDLPSQNQNQQISQSNAPAQKDTNKEQQQSKNIIDLLGGDEEITTTPISNPKIASNNNFDDFGEMQISQPVLPKHTFTAIEDATIKIVFKCTKQSADTVEITMEYGNKTPFIINELQFQVAVQKHNKLTMNPISSTQIPPNSSNETVQVMSVVNSMAGQKSIAMKVRLQYNINGKPVSLDSIVQDFPKGW